AGARTGVMGVRTPTILSGGVRTPTSSPCRRRSNSGDARPGIITPPQNCIQDDSPESGCPDSVQHEVAKLQCEVASSENQGNGHDDQFTVVAQINLVYNPDPCGGYGNQPEDHQRHAAENRTSNGLNQGTELRGEPQQNRDKYCDD